MYGGTLRIIRIDKNRRYSGRQPAKLFYAVPGSTAGKPPTTSCKIAAPFAVQVHSGSRGLSKGSFGFAGLCTFRLLSSLHRRCSLHRGLLHTSTMQQVPFSSHRYISDTANNETITILPAGGVSENTAMLQVK